MTILKQELGLFVAVMMIFFRFGGGKALLHSGVSHFLTSLGRNIGGLVYWQKRSYITFDRTCSLEATSSAEMTNRLGLCLAKVG